MADDVFNVTSGENSNQQMPENLGVDLSAIAGDIMIDAPEVQTHVVEQHAREQAGAPTDSDGVAFDPAIHAADSSGNGIKTATGKWRKRRGASKSGATGSRVGSASSAASAGGPTAEQQAARAAGIAMTQMVFILGQAFGGAEWAPRTINNEKGEVVMDENVMMTEAHVAYCEAKGIKDIPPGVALAFAYISYAAPRFTMPETKKRAARAKTWFTLQIAKWRVRRELKKRGIKAKVEVSNGELLVDGAPANV